MGETDPGIVFLHPAEVLALGRGLLDAAGTLRTGAGGTDRDLPEVPYDWVGLHHAVIRLDEAREAFENRLATAVGDAGGRAVQQVLDTGGADHLDQIPIPGTGG